jgi:hypothetical protein
MVRTGYPLRLFNLCLLLRVNVGLLLHLLVLLKLFPSAVKVVIAFRVALLFCAVLLVLIILIFVQLIPDALDAFVVLFEALVLLLLGIGRVVVSAVQKRVEPTGQTLESGLVEPHLGLTRFRTRRENLFRLQVGEQTRLLLLLGSSGGSGSLGFGGRCRRLGRLGRLGRHQLCLDLLIGRVAFTLGRLRRRIKVLLVVTVTLVRVFVVVVAVEAAELATLGHRPLATLLLDFVLGVPLELGLLVRFVQEVERLFESTSFALRVGSVRVVLVFAFALEVAANRALRNRVDRPSGHPVQLVLVAHLVIAAEVAALDTTASLAAFDLAEVKHLRVVDEVLPLETDIHRRHHVELHPLNFARLLLVGTTTLATLLESLVAGEAFELVRELLLLVDRLDLDVRVGCFYCLRLAVEPKLQECTYVSYTPRDESATTEVLTSSRISVRYLSNILKSFLPRTFKSSTHALISPVVKGFFSSLLEAC